jgi:hypothetical protein
MSFGHHAVATLSQRDDLALAFRKQAPASTRVLLVKARVAFKLGPKQRELLGLKIRQK